MKIKRYLAKDMREAIRNVRDEQGPDAMILSTRRLAEGIELIAAVDYDEALMHQAAVAFKPLRRQLTGLSGDDSRADRAGEEPRAAAGPPPVAAVGRRQPPAESPVTAAGRRQPPAESPVTAAGRRQPPVESPVEPPAPARSSDKPSRPDWHREVDRELRSIKKLLQTQMSQLAFGQLGREQPQRANMLRELTAFGLTRDVALELLRGIPADIDADRAGRMPLGLLSKKLRAGETDICETGGVVAIVGPTGVGKTTTLAKLAAHFVMREGRDDVAMITTDLFRIGGQEQLFHYSRLLGVPLYTANDSSELHQTLKRLRDYRLVLIDTAGMSHRDMRLNRQLAMLRDGCSRLQIQLALSVCQHPSVLDEVVGSFMSCAPNGVILTKLDEAAELGGALSILLRHNLTANYVTNGQRVPEDIATVRAHHLVARMVELGRHRTRPDDDSLAEAFGGLAHVLV